MSEETTPDVPGRARLAARATAAVGRLSRRTGRGAGSVIGGRLGLAIDRQLVTHLGRGRDVVLVTGTNGKTTTTRLLVAALGGAEAVATNAAGSNLPAGLAVALATGPPVGPVVLEVDEGYLPRMVEELDAQVVVLLNLSRDQLDRVGEVRMVAARFRQALAERPGVTVVANADDPLVVWAAGAASQVRWVGAGQLWRADAVGCPACEGAIVFDADGPHWRSDCGLERPATELELADGALVTGDGGRVPAPLALPGRFNLANAAMAAMAASVLGVDVAGALVAMGSVSDVEGRFATATHAGHDVRLLLAKNPAGFSELLALVEGGPEPVVVGINARVADGHDPSWLWDVPFERLAGRDVVASGERASDLAVRLRYGGVAHVTEHDQLAAVRALDGPAVEYIGNYTAFQDMRRLLARAPIGYPAPRPVPPAAPVPAVRAYAGDWPAARPHDSVVRIVVVHPDLLGTYGDGGNGVVLAGRAAWRGLDVELVMVPSGADMPASADLYCLGGGEDGPQVRAAARLSGGALARAVDDGAVVLAVCAGYQVVGQSFPDAAGVERPGIGLLDVHTVKGEEERAVGELRARPVTDGLAVTLTGFENHSGVTRLGADASPLAVVEGGVGNGDGSEGARAGNVFGTYLHGPVLARNPQLADLLLALATGAALEPLDDTEEQRLHDERLSASRRVRVRML